MTNDKMRHASKWALTLLLWVWLLLAARCQTTEPGTVEPLPSPSPPAVALFPPVQPGDGSDLIDRLLDRGVIRVGVRVWPEADFSPPAFRGYSETTIGRALTGFEVEIAHLIAVGLGLELELVEAYPPVILSGDWQSQWDIALASLSPFDQPVGEVAAPTPIRYSQPYAYMPMGILVRADEENIRTVDHLAGRRLGVLEYSAYQRLLLAGAESLTVQGEPLLASSWPADIQIVGLSNLQKTIRQMGAPTATLEVEALFGPAPVFQEAVKNQAVKLAPDAQNLGLQPLAVAVVPQDGLEVERLTAEIDVILNRARRQGVLSEIYLRWYGQDLSGIEKSE